MKKPLPCMGHGKGFFAVYGTRQRILWLENLARKNYLLIQIFAVLGGEVHGKALPSPWPVDYAEVVGLTGRYAVYFLCRVLFRVFAVTLFFAVCIFGLCRDTFLCCVSLP